MKKYLLILFLVQIISIYAQAQTIEQQLSFKLSSVYADNGQSSPGNAQPGNGPKSPALNISKASYPPNLYSRTSVSGLLMYLGGGLLGGFIGYEMAAANGETTGDGFGGIPYVLSGIVVGATALSTAGIHHSAKKYCKSSCWYAAGGILLTMGMAVGMGTSPNGGTVVIPAALLAPFVGSWAYLHFGKPTGISE